MTEKTFAQMCAEQSEERTRKIKEHSLEGIYEPRPADFGVAWPTVRTETFVEMVFGSIQKRARATQADIGDDTGLDQDTIGVALANLLLWKKQVGSVLKKEGGVTYREYFVKEGARR